MWPGPLVSTGPPAAQRAENARRIVVHMFKTAIPVIFRTWNRITPFKVRSPVFATEHNISPS